MNEEWRAVKGYEGLYEVSNMGRVRSLDRNITLTRKGTTFIYHHKGRVLSPNVNPHGYYGVRLRCGGKHEDGLDNRKLVHRLVAEAFIPNPRNLPQVNHKDENPKNCRVDNLEWVTARENCIYGTRLEKISKANTNHPKRSTRIAQYTLGGEFVREFPSYNEARRCGYYNIHRLIHGGANRSQAYGCLWKEVRD